MKYSRRSRDCRMLQESLYLRIGGQQIIELSPEVRVAGAGLIQILATLVVGYDFQRGPKDGIGFFGLARHELMPSLIEERKLHVARLREC
jgi:hypothetical protein